MIFFRLLFSGGEMSDNFIEDLHEMLHKWGYPPWQVREILPHIVKVFEGVGILQRVGDVYFVTELVEYDGAWESAWELLEKEGIAGPQGPAD